MTINNRLARAQNGEKKYKNKVHQNTTGKSRSKKIKEQHKSVAPLLFEIMAQGTTCSSFVLERSFQNIWKPRKVQGLEWPHLKDFTSAQFFFLTTTLLSHQAPAVKTEPRDYGKIGQRNRAQV